MENSSVYVLYLLSDAFDVSAVPAGERLKMVCKLVGVVTPKTLQFGARSRRLENLDTRQTGYMRHTAIHGCSMQLAGCAYCWLAAGYVAIKFMERRCIPSSRIIVRRELMDVRIIVSA